MGFESFNPFRKKETEDEAKIRELKESIANYEAWKKRIDHNSEGETERRVDVQKMDNIDHQINKWRKELSELTGEPIPVDVEEGQEHAPASDEIKSSHAEEETDDSAA